MRVGPENVGQRVVVRYRLADGRATDVLGDLTAWDDAAGIAVVDTRTGPVTMPLADLLMGHPVPPAPVRRGPRPAPDLSVLGLHEVMARGWQPLESRDYGGWRLRAAQGFTGRSNSVLPLGPPPSGLGAAVDHVERWYAERGLPARFCVPWELGCGPGDPAYGSDPLEAELVARGYVLDTPTLVQTLPLASAGSAGPDRSWVVDERAMPDEEWLRLYHYRGEDLPAVAVEVLVKVDPADAVAFVSLRDADGRAGAISRAVSTGGWTGVSAVEVAPELRRQGLARLVMAAVLTWGRDHGDHSAYLQVARSNAAGLALYERLGFRPHSGYHYRIRS